MAKSSVVQASVNDSAITKLRILESNDHYDSQSRPYLLELVLCGDFSGSTINPKPDNANLSKVDKALSCLRIQTTSDNDQVRSKLCQQMA
mmetsp:Transcript_6103/g.10441  ORF Transcript_6103/g.10441 Transcript_6103/m.10441 type:complete len:90 (-) Transcript_6103:1463-1732(-)